MRHENRSTWDGTALSVRDRSYCLGSPWPMEHPWARCLWCPNRPSLGRFTSEYPPSESKVANADCCSLNSNIWQTNEVTAGLSHDGGRGELAPIKCPYILSRLGRTHRIPCESGKNEKCRLS